MVSLRGRETLSAKPGVGRGHQTMKSKKECGSEWENQKEEKAEEKRSFGSNRELAWSCCQLSPWGGVAATRGQT